MVQCYVCNVVFVMCTVYARLNKLEERGNEIRGTCSFTPSFFPIK